MHSVVIPIFNEAENLGHLHARMGALLDRLQGDWEVILVNDGSSDGSDVLIDLICGADSRFKAVHLARNFGQQAALFAGLKWSSGQTVTTIDADFQDPPEVIEEFFKKWQEGYKLVYGVRRVRHGESAWKLWTARLFYGLLRRLSGVTMPSEAGDFRLMDRTIVDVISELPERSPYLRGLSVWGGFRSAAVVYDRAPRALGRSHYSLVKMFGLASAGITSFSTAPLRLSWIIAAMSITGSIGLSVMAFVFDQWLGWTTPQWFMFNGMLFMMGVQMLLLGIIGEYIAKIHTQVLGRPLFVVERTKNLVTSPSAVTSDKKSRLFAVS